MLTYTINRFFHLCSRKKFDREYWQVQLAKRQQLLTALTCEKIASRTKKNAQGDDHVDEWNPCSFFSFVRDHENYQQVKGQATQSSVKEGKKWWFLIDVR